MPKHCERMLQWVLIMVKPYILLEVLSMSFHVKAQSKSDSAPVIDSVGAIVKAACRNG